MQRQQYRARTLAAMRANLTTVVIVAVSSCAIAIATPPAEVIVQDVDLDNYIHYHQDLLYTWMGDNRGFGPEHDLARDAAAAELASIPNLTVELEPFIYSGTTYYNVIATQTGTDFPDEIYVVGAHYDSVNNPGADDNGTGPALVMEAARVLARYRSPRTIMYCLFDREEQGRRGSIAFVNDHSDENIIMAVTADMVGHDSGAYGMDVYGRTSSSQVVTGLADAIDVYGQGLATFLNLGNFSFSDHWSFEAAGIPACVVIERCFLCNPYYHTQNDAVDNPHFPNGDYLDYTMPTNLTRAFVGYLVDQIGITLWHDADNDADVDWSDYAAFQRCFGVPVAPACTAFDADRDNDIDLDDFAGFIDAYTGPRE